MKNQITPGMPARTRFWRSKTAGEGAELTWCNRLVHVGARIPIEALPRKYQQDDETWFAITFLDGEPPATASTWGDPPRPLWPWPRRGLMALTPDQVAARA